MLLIPLVTGAVLGRPVGGRIVLVLLLAMAALGLFCARTPLEAWLGISPWRAQNPRERRVIHNSLYIYASVSLGALSIVLWQIHSYGLFLVGAAVATAFVGQALLKGLGRHARTAAQLAGSIGLTATGAAAYYVASSRLDTAILIIWAANWVFAANQILYVQTRIHSARASTFGERLAQGKWFLLAEIVMLFILALARRTGWLPSLALVAFAPVLVRGFVWFFSNPTRLQIRRLGITELIHAVIFAALLIAGFQVRV